MWHTLLKPLALGLGLVTLALLALVWGGAPPAARAAGPACKVCLDGGCTYTTIQAAVDDPGCQEIKVAQGVYTGVQARPVPVGYPYPPASGLITQVVYISRTVTVHGGYTITNWTTPDPVAQPTTLDAQGLGRVIVIAGDISPTIEGLGLTNGFAPGLNSGDIGYSGDGGGGGAYIISATATISACQVFSNTTDNIGGGLALWHSPAILISNSVISNTGHWGGGLSLFWSNATVNANNVTSNIGGQGGGLYLFQSNATLSANSVTSNTADYGGGLGLYYGNPTLISNSVAFNTAGSLGGGLELFLCPATLISNSVTSNTAFWGGGLFLEHSDATFSANSVTANIADYGGGLILINSAAMLTNAVVADNQADATGSGLYVYGQSEPRLLHTTVARNGGGDGSGLYVSASGGASLIWLTNTILVNQAVGITVAEGCTVAMSGTLWYGNGTNWGGAGMLTHTEDYTGNPTFVGPSGGDYHLRPNSAAINRGVNAGVTTDKDGLPRDARPDLGAYEFTGTVTDTYLPVIWKNAR